MRSRQKLGILSLISEVIGGDFFFLKKNPFSFLQTIVEREAERSRIYCWKRWVSPPRVCLAGLFCIIFHLLQPHIWGHSDSGSDRRRWPSSLSKSLLRAYYVRCPGLGDSVETRRSTGRGSRGICSHTNPACCQKDSLHSAMSVGGEEKQ